MIYVFFHIFTINSKMSFLTFFFFENRRVEFPNFLHERNGNNYKMTHFWSKLTKIWPFWPDSKEFKHFYRKQFLIIKKYFGWKIQFSPFWPTLWPPPIHTIFICLKLRFLNFLEKKWKKFLYYYFCWNMVLIVEFNIFCFFYTEIVKIM